MVDIALETTARVPPERVFEHLRAFEQYAGYTDYLAAIERVDADSADPTTDTDVLDRYDVTARWWRLTHTVETAVTVADRPSRIDWTVIGDVDVGGTWTLEPVPTETNGGTTADEPPTGTRLGLTVRYDLSSIPGGDLDLPALVSVETVADRLVPRVVTELEAVLAAIVRDVENSDRAVTVDVVERPDA